MSLLICIVIEAILIFIGSKIFKGIEVDDLGQAFLVSIVVAGLSLTLGTFLKIVSLGILSFGIFTLLLDAILFQVADFFLSGFKVKNFWWALALAAAVALAGRLIGLGI